MSEKVKNILKSYWFDGILLICLGALIILWPDATPTILCIVTSIMLIVLGLIKTIGFFVSKSGERKALELLIGLIQLAVGIAILVKTDFFIDFFQIIAAVLMIYGCILMFVQAFDLRKEKGARFVASIVFGIITLILAVLMLINPSFLMSAIAYITGIALIVEGLAIIIVLRKPKTKDVPQSSQLAK